MHLNAEDLAFGRIVSIVLPTKLQEKKVLANRKQGWNLEIWNILPGISAFRPRISGDWFRNVGLCTEIWWQWNTCANERQSHYAAWRPSFISAINPFKQRKVWFIVLKRGNMFSCCNYTRLNGQGDRLQPRDVWSQLRFLSRFHYVSLYRPAMPFGNNKKYFRRSF